MTADLDPVIDALCVDAAVYLDAMARAARSHGLTLPAALEMFRRHAELVTAARSCGYLQTATRGRGARHNSYSEGAATPSRKPSVNSNAQVKARARQWGHA